MIQDEEQFIKLLKETSMSENDDVILFIKDRGANQMTCTKILMRLKNIKLKEANVIVQNSIHWNEFKESNENIKKIFFSK